MSPPTHFKLNTGALIPAVGLGACPDPSDIQLLILCRNMEIRAWRGDKGRGLCSQERIPTH